MGRPTYNPNVSDVIAVVRADLIEGHENLEPVETAVFTFGHPDPTIYPMKADQVADLMSSRGADIRPLGSNNGVFLNRDAGARGVETAPSRPGSNKTTVYWSDIDGAHSLTIHDDSISSVRHQRLQGMRVNADPALLERLGLKFG